MSGGRNFTGGEDMYLHLGQSTVVPESEVIGVFDMDNTTGSHITRRFLSEAEKSGQIISVSEELPNSFIVCDESNPRRKAPDRPAKGGAKQDGQSKNTVKVYLSQLSTQTLLKRSATMRFD